jgi:hypothetical protein
MDIDGRKMDTPWNNNDGKSMDWTKFHELVNEKYNDHTRISTNGSKKEEKVGYVVATD